MLQPQRWINPGVVTAFEVDDMDGRHSLEMLQCANRWYFSLKLVDVKNHVIRRQPRFRAARNLFFVDFVDGMAVEKGFKGGAVPGDHIQVFGVRLFV
jgi:hypothetical protein